MTLVKPRMTIEIPKAQVIFNLVAYLFECIQIGEEAIMWEEEVVCSRQELPRFVYNFQEYISNKYDTLNNHSRLLIINFIQNHHRPAVLTDCFLSTFVYETFYRSQFRNKEPAGIV